MTPEEMARESFANCNSALLAIFDPDLENEYGLMVLPCPNQPSLDYDLWLFAVDRNGSPEKEGEVFANGCAFVSLTSPVVLIQTWMPFQTLGLVTLED